MKIVIKLLIVIVLITLSLPIDKIQAQNSPAWIEVAGGHTDLTYASDYNCQWDAHAPALINLAGMCGRSGSTKIKYMIYAHNWWCDKVMCHYDLKQGGIFAWPALYDGYNNIRLFINGRYYIGMVIEVIHDAGSRGIDGNTEFPCKYNACMTLTTCADLIPSYVVVRIGIY